MTALATSGTPPITDIDAATSVFAGVTSLVDGKADELSLDAFKRPYKPTISFLTATGGEP
jgi:hypothetical protein